MSQQINDNFQLLAGLPLDDRTRKTTIADRDAIASTRRFQGLQCFVEQTQTLYQLQGGIANSNWVGIAGANTSNALETIIDGFYVLLAGKTTPLDWEVNDKFRGWIGNRYVVGTILSLPVSLPADIDNPARVLLSVDSNISISGGMIDFPRLLSPQASFPVPTGVVAKYAIINNTIYIIETPNNLTEFNTFTQASPGANVVFKNTAEFNEYVQIFY